MGNSASQQNKAFHKQYKRLIGKIRKAGNRNNQKVLIQHFVERQNLTINQIRTDYGRIKHPEGLPLRLIESNIVMHIFLYIYSEDYDETIFVEGMSFLARACKILKKLSLSPALFDTDLYHILSGDLLDIFESQKAANRAEDLLIYLSQKKSNKIQDSVQYMSVRDSEILNGAVNLINDIFSQYSLTIEMREHVVRSFFVPDLPQNAQDILEERRKDQQFLNTLKDVQKLIPQQFLIVRDKLFKGISAMYLYTGTIALKRSLVKKVGGSERLAMARCMIAILHEIAHKKRKIHGANDYYFFKTPEFIAHERVSEEAGCYLEEWLFGGIVELGKLTEQEAELILDGENYTNPQRYFNMRRNLQHCLKSGPSGRNFKIESDLPEETCHKFRINLPSPPQSSHFRVRN